MGKDKAVIEFYGLPGGVKLQYVNILLKAIRSL